MQKMKVVLVGVNAKFIHSNLAIRYLKAYTAPMEYECSILEFSINDRKERILERILIEKPQVVAFSCYIWNIEYVNNLAEHIKLIYPSIEILYGGPEVSYDSNSFLENSSGDYVIEGEGEETYKEFIEYKLNKRAKNSIKGLYFKVGNSIMFGGKRELMDINKVVFPYNDEDNLDNKIVYYEASRGCPFSCKYCLSSTIHGVRFLNLERVKSELAFLMRKNVRLIKFVDRTFNCNTKMAMEIWNFIINADTNTAFHFEISADLLSKEEIELLRKAPKGRIQFEVGVQTTNNEVLRNIDRHVTYEHIREKVSEIKKCNNIKQHLDLIAGLPGEDFVSFKNSFNDVYKTEPEEIQMGFLKLLKGSSMRNEAEKWGMVYSPFPPYEIFKTNSISYNELMKLKKIEEVVDKYYNSQKFNSILKYFVKKYETPFEFYSELADFFYEKGFFDRNIAFADYYKVFLDFNHEKFNKDGEIVSDIIKYDYIKHNKKRWIPEFLQRDSDKIIEKSIREKIIRGNLKFSSKNFHIEKFKIDIFKFINAEIIEKIDLYIAFDEAESDNIIDVTNLYKEIF